MGLSNRKEKKMKEYTVLFYALSRFGNLHSLGTIITKNVDKAIEDGKKKFFIHLRTNDNMRVFVFDEDGNTLSDYTFERGEK